jgi:hypothetical protein
MSEHQPDQTKSAKSSSETGDTNQAVKTGTGSSYHEATAAYSEAANAFAA